MEHAIIATLSGKVRGRRHPAGGWMFLGIPYGDDTSGANRFRPPRPRSPWAGVRDALSFGPYCPQGQPAIPGEDAHSVRHLGLGSSEDCLLVNVWTPDCGRRTDRPVLVWLHGGGFGFGSASHPQIDGGRLSAHGDAVIVSVQHRLNVFGFLFLGDLPGVSEQDSTNAGLRDLVLALQWVRDNAAAFGGDAFNVTLFGQSGGGRKICALMAMPSAKGLFGRAIVQSGAHPRFISKSQGAQFTAGFLQDLGIESGNLATLRAIPADTLHARVTDFCSRQSDPSGGAPGRSAEWFLSPVIDCDVLPGSAEGDSAPTFTQSVPLLIGSNRDEAALHLARYPDAGQLTTLELRERCRSVLGEQADQVIKAHQVARPNATPWELLVTIASEDRRMLSIAIAEVQATSAQAPVFMYLFTWESNFRLYRAAHTMELPFVFRTLDSTPIVGTKRDRFALSDMLSNAWLAFARSGNPSHPGLPRWTSYTVEDRATMILDVPSAMRNDPGGIERKALGRDMAFMPWERNSFAALLARR